MDDEFAKLIRRINPPRVVVGNDACQHATVIQVESVNRHGTLLEIVQVLSDLNLVVTKAYISSDAGWFMDDHTSIELTGSDRPGLLSELSAVMADLGCNVVNGEIWTHNARAAAVIHVTDQTTGESIEDSERLSTIKELLFNVMKGNSHFKTPRMCVSSSGVIHRGRRLHQMLFADRDFERPESESLKFESAKQPHVTVLDCSDRDYTVVTIRSLDRPKLLFDTVCTLTDMEYVVFHGTVITGRMEAYQGLELEVCTDDRFGLLSDITRIFRENGLCIRRAEISTKSGKAKDTFFVTDVSGNPVDSKTVDLIQHQIGQVNLQVKGDSSLSPKHPKETTGSFLFKNLFKGRSFQNFKLIKSCT
ncbi:hypothetical protein COLO4_16637 [Corchorus olitorius]|uniref:ACT domain-containing protein ACR n=1 Tax=Corchorus olitorius TaxID=93759 RepID=A0A1R3JG75_9ROSI|nr:hypothetical protein COLO4_16637 [Corchorus olitorius]